MKKPFLLMMMLLLSLAAAAQIAITADFPKVSIAGKTGGEITIDEMINVGGLGTTNTELIITKFTMTFFPAEDHLITLTSNSAEFSQAMISNISGFKAGGKFYIEDIEVMIPDGRIIQLASQTFTIK